MDRIVPLKCEETVVKRLLAMALVLGCGQAGATAQNNAGSQNAPAQSSSPQKQSAPAQPTPAAGHTAPGGASANPFPEDETNVPILPTKNAPDLPNGHTPGGLDLSRVFPAGDMDPVPSPEGAAGAEGSGQGFSSSDSGVDSLLPSPDADVGKKHGKKDEDDLASVHHESAAEDENVGKYYLDNKDWRAALSRYESALVLDPDNPDVYWGLAESQRHLGQFADARANYLKVMEYDPGSRHAKDAKKTLEEPELANAKPAQARSAQAPQ
jgi:tetratricopeptide (TPR) repeat protein